MILDSDRIENKIEKTIHFGIKLIYYFFTNLIFCLIERNFCTKNAREGWSLVCTLLLLAANLKFKNTGKIIWNFIVFDPFSTCKLKEIITKWSLIIN